MAFIKEEIIKGFSVNYWRIVSLSLNWAERTGTLVLAGYKNRQVRIDNPKNGQITTRRYTISQETFDMYFDASTIPNDSITDNLEKTGLDRDFAYNYIKMVDEFFQDAEDLIEDNT